MDRPAHVDYVAPACHHKNMRSRLLAAGATLVLAATLLSAPSFAAPPFAAAQSASAATPASPVPTSTG